MRASALGKLGAVAVAVALTGAPALAARADHAGEHRCACRTHRTDECTCARCHEAARPAAPPAEETSAPPCHARRVETPAREKPAPEAKVPAGAVVLGCCGAEDPDGGLPGVDRFTLAGEDPPASRVPSGRIPFVERGVREAPSVPELPPPRAA